MTDKTIKIEMTGNEAIINAGLAAFCYQGGYQDERYILGEDGNSTLQPNPISKTDFAKQRLSEFFRSEVAKYNSAQAAQQAAEAAQAQTLGAMDLITMNVEII